MALNKALAFLLLAAVFSTCGNIALKLSRDVMVTNLPSWISSAHPMILFGIATSFYALNLICFAKALDWLPVSVGYPVLAAVGFLLLSVCSALLLGEKISSLQITGIVIIVVGIFVLARTNI